MLEVKSPWNNETVGTVKTHNSSEIESIVQEVCGISIHKGQDFPPKERINVLKSFIKIIQENTQSLAELATSEGGKPITDSIIEIKRGAEGVESCIEVLKSESGSVIPMNINEASSNRIAFTQKEPIGVVLAISAFNHPFNLIIHQVIPAIAVGCPVIVKPAEDTPLSCLKIVEMLYEAGLPKNRCHFVMPENLELATKLVSDERIDFFSFIGSSKVGWFLRSKLAPGTRCSLEHGGMAPTFITKNSDLDLCAKSIARGGFYHAGQVCVSVQRIYLSKTISEVSCAESIAAESSAAIASEQALSSRLRVASRMRPFCSIISSFFIYHLELLKVRKFYHPFIRPSISRTLMGIISIDLPSGDNASLTALAIAAGAPRYPDSPEPF